MTFKRYFDKIIVIVAWMVTVSAWTRGKADNIIVGIFKFGLIGVMERLTVRTQAMKLIAVC